MTVRIRAVADATGGTATEPVELRHLWSRTFQEIQRDNMKQMSTRWTHANTNNGRSVCEKEKKKERTRTDKNHTRTRHLPITPRKQCLNSSLNRHPKPITLFSSSEAFPSSWQSPNDGLNLGCGNIRCGRCNGRDCHWVCRVASPVVEDISRN